MQRTGPSFFAVASSPIAALLRFHQMGLSTISSFSFRIGDFPASLGLAPPCKKVVGIAACMGMAAAPPSHPPLTGVGFRTLMETYIVDVHRAECRPLNVPLIDPFTIASSRLDRVENVAIRVELVNGCVGWGEAPVLPHVTAEDQPTVLAKAADACRFLRQSSGKTLGIVLAEINEILPNHSSASVSYLLFFTFSPFRQAVCCVELPLNFWLLCSICLFCRVSTFQHWDYGLSFSCCFVLILRS